MQERSVAGDTFWARIEGTLEHGRLRLQVQVIGDDGSLFARTGVTQWETGRYWVEIPRETLP